MDSLERSNEIIRNKGTMTYKRVMIGVAMTGLVRAEWMLARYGQVIPCNWSQVDCIQWMDQCTPIEFLVADARNVIVHHFIQQKFEWLLQLDHDVCLQYDTFIRMNQYMLDKKVPFLSGLYFTKSKPSEPLIYRGRGNSYYKDWKLGDKVWVDGIPSGTTLIHRSILELLYNESKPYEVSPGLVVKEVYETPSRTWLDPEQKTWFASSGTEDLAICTRIMEEDIFRSAGWPEYADKEFPFLCDTGIFGRHIDNNGVQYPANGEEQEFLVKE